jgi:hypothetical protein
MRNVNPALVDVNDGLPILSCRRVGYIELETTACPVCGAKKHIHGISRDMLDGTPSHRSAHCQVPPHHLKDQRSLAAWWETVKRGYMIRLVA